MVAKVSRGSALRVEIELADGSRLRPLAWKYTERPLAAKWLEWPLEAIICLELAGVATRCPLLGIGLSGRSQPLAASRLEFKSG